MKIKCLIFYKTLHGQFSTVSTNNSGYCSDQLTRVCTPPFSFAFQEAEEKEEFSRQSRAASGRTSRSATSGTRPPRAALTSERCKGVRRTLARSVFFVHGFSIGFQRCKGVFMVSRLEFEGAKV